VSRRRFLAALAALVVFAPAGAGAQAPGKTYRIAVLALPGTPLPQTVTGIESFRRELGTLGWVEGRNVVIDVRHADREQLDETAARIVRERFDLIVTMAIPSALAAKKATSTIPIVMATSADPVGSGLVASLARPGGNVTGTSFVAHELPGKRLELLKQMVPRLRRVGVVYPERSASLAFTTQWIAETERAAGTLGLSVQRLPITIPTEWDPTLAAAKRDGVGALTVVESPDVIAQADRLAAAALKHQLPAIFGSRSHVAAGGLMAYGAVSMRSWTRAAVYVDKILRGAKPADLPVEQATSFGLLINAKTAGALHLTIPAVLRLQAEEIIE
jgi:putative ABC transport system substrate-binding protein